MQCRLRTLVLLTIVVPPMLWGVYRFFELPGTLYWTMMFALATIVCAPMIALRLFAFFQPQRRPNNKN